MQRQLPEIERSLIKKFRKELWGPFVKAVKEYELIRPGDHIAVCISGGKDSLLLAKLLQELHRHGERNFTLSFLAMDPGYLPEKRNDMQQALDLLQIPALVYDSDIFEVADELAGEYPCYLCARMRRGSLYAKAQEVGANKIALGHHFDDVVETILLNILFAGKYNTMMPKLKAKNFPGMELIRPLVYVREEDILRFTDYAGLHPLDCACTVSATRTGNRRYQVKAILARLRDEIPNVDISIYRSAQNVQLDQVLGWTQEEAKHFFLDGYDGEEL